MHTNGTASALVKNGCPRLYTLLHRPPAAGGYVDVSLEAWLSCMGIVGGCWRRLLAAAAAVSTGRPTLASQRLSSWAHRLGGQHLLRVAM